MPPRALQQALRFVAQAGIKPATTSCCVHQQGFIRRLTTQSTGSSLINVATMKFITPFQTLPSDCIATTSQSVVYALDEEIALKVPLQYEVTHNLEMSYNWDRSLRSFVAMEKESAVYNALEKFPHPNLPRRLTSGQPYALFLERLVPFREALPNASQSDRLRWALDLLAALSWLEKLGFVHRDVEIRNLGIDRLSTRLRLVNFGSAISREHPDFLNGVKRDHFEVATCLHSIMSGIDPFDSVHSQDEADELRQILETGEWEIEKDAEVIAEVIQDGWAGKSVSGKFSGLFDRVKSIIEQSGQDVTPNESPDKDYSSLQSRCLEWLRSAERNPLWKDAEDYVSDCQNVGHRVVLDDWR